MIIDYLLPDAPANIESDVCIVGGGPAGITLALELAKLGRDVALIEGGGTTPSIEGQALYEGDIVGQKYYPLNVARLRALGGTTGHWGGYCGVFSEMDFEKRHWIPYSGWPIKKPDLDSYYEQAQKYFELGPYEYGTEYWSEKYSDFPDVDTNNLVPRFLQHDTSPIRFGTAYLSDLDAIKQIRVFINANATRLCLNEAGKQIVQVDLQNFLGKRGAIKANIYIIACGGIENARLLLASNNINQSGVGNDKGLVGRFFMEHIEFPCARVFDFDSRQIIDLSRIKVGSDLDLIALFSPSPAKQQKLKIGHGSGMFAPPNVSAPLIKDGWKSFGAFWRALKERQLQEDAAGDLQLWIKDFDTFAGALALRLRGLPVRGAVTAETGVFGINIMSEQVPNPTSRVLLSEKRDAFGYPLADLDWQLTAIDRRTVRQTMILMGAEVNRLGIGRFQLNEWLREENDFGWPPDFRGAFHHMGTTRMAETDTDGVVDKNCKVYGVANLYIAGSSVFATSSYVNPTLTIVALAIRLATHVGTIRPFF
jgi:choline dehydrogenase-like flavoprotein